MCDSAFEQITLESERIRLFREFLQVLEVRHSFWSSAIYPSFLNSRDQFQDKTPPSPAVALLSLDN